MKRDIQAYKNGRHTLFILATFLCCWFNLWPVLSSAQKTSPTQIRYVGSSTIGNFIKDADPHYQSSKFHLNTTPESAGGEQAILEGRADLAGIAREPSAATLASGVKVTLIGRDAIAVVVNRQLGINNLSMEELQLIFSGEAKNWKEFGGPDLKIRPFIVGAESATQNVFRSTILGNKNYKNCEVISPDVNILPKVRLTPGSIGHISFSFLGSLDNVIPISVNGQEANLENPNYPITRPLYLLWWPQRKRVEKFIQWLSTPPAQTILQWRFIKTMDAISSDEKLPELDYIGSSTVGIFIQNAASKYRSVHFNIETKSESDGGERAIIEGKTSLAGIARFPDHTTLQKGIASALIGYDAISVIVHPSNPITSLTLDQLAKIYSGQITNWKSIGGLDKEISKYTVSKGSATRVVFKAKVMGELDYIGCKTASPDPDLISMVANDEAAIGHISLAFLQKLDPVKKLAVSGQIPSNANFNYPITRPLFLLYDDQNPEASAFVNWSLSPEGQALIREHFISNFNLEEGVAGKGKEGKLVVYTRTHAIVDGGTWYYPHTAYNLYDASGAHLQKVSNHIGINDETPSELMLEAGEYQIGPDPPEQDRHLITVRIQSGEMTKVDMVAALNNGHDNTIIETREISGDGLLDKFKFLKFYGDLRVRAALDRSHSDNRFRGRLRLRTGLNASILPGLNIGFRIVTMQDPNDPNSTHVDFSNGFNGFPFVLDRAYVHYNPTKFHALNLWFGKFSHLLISSSIYPELVWDADIQPEGGAFSLGWNKLGPLQQFKFTNGTYIMGQFVSGTGSPWLNTSQLSAMINAGSSLQLTLALENHYYHDMKGRSTSNGIFDANAGNSTVSDSSGSYYATDFNIANVFLLATFSKLKMPLTLKLNMIGNLSASENKNGFSAGAMYGDLSRKGNWRIYYQFQIIEQDAVFSPMVQDDFLRQTNFTGHAGGLAYAFSNKVSLHTWVLADQGIIEKTGWQTRYRLDFDVKF